MDLTEKQGRSTWEGLEGGKAIWGEGVITISKNKKNFKIKSRQLKSL